MKQCLRSLVWVCRQSALLALQAYVALDARHVEFTEVRRLESEYGADMEALRLKWQIMKQESMQAELWSSLAQAAWYVTGHCLSAYPRVPTFWTHRTKFYCFCDRSVREKAWRSRKRVAQAT